MNLLGLLVAISLLVSGCYADDNNPNPATPEKSTESSESIDAQSPISSTGTSEASSESSVSEADSSSLSTTAPESELTKEFSGSLGNTTASGTTEVSASETNSTIEVGTASQKPIDTDNDTIITAQGTGATSESSNSGDSFPPSSVADFFTDSTLSTTATEGDTTTEAKESVCTPSSCRNGGTCVEDTSISSPFSCVCPEGFVGIRCGIRDECKKNEDGTSCKDGACIYSDDGLVRSCACFPGMFWDEEKRECREQDLPCFPNPCQNGGECTEEDDAFTCGCATGFEGKNCSIENKCGVCDNGQCTLNGVKSVKQCVCNKGFYFNEESTMCESVSLPCIPNPCKHGSGCNVLPENKSNCTCSKGFSGKLCEIVDECSTDEDCKHGTCVLSPDKSTRKCKCEDGFYLEKEEHFCKGIKKPCEPNPCSNDGICTTVSANIFNCTCSEGYTGSTCSIRDKCKMDWGNVYCGDAQCNNNFDLGIYYCSCEEDQYFAYSQRKCLEVDLCPLMDCDSTEKCIQGKCVCKENYKWNNETQKCEPDFCSSNPCPLSDMICEEGKGSTTYKCSCKDGYTFNGTHCNKAYCIFPALNDCEQICKENDSGYLCECKEGFALNEDNRTCLYLSNNTCTNKTCDKGSCVFKDDLEICICPPGHVEVDGQCVDLCSAGQSSVISDFCPSDECEIVPKGEFRCKCEGKYSLSNDNTTCIVRNICEEGEIGWKTCSNKDAECVQNWESLNGFDCRCKEWQVLVSGTCTDLCKLESNQKRCALQGAFCDYDENWRIVCKCPPYFKAGKNGTCNMPADISYLVTLPLDKTSYQMGNARQRRSLNPLLDYHKILNDVSATAKEMFDGFKQASILDCRLSSDDILCTTEMQFRTVQETDLKRLQNKEICINKDDTNRCLLPPSLVLVKERIDKEIDFKLTNPCNADIKEDICGSETLCYSSPENKSFNCSCKPGFTMRRKMYPFRDTQSFIEACKDINECTQGEPCPLNSNCINTIGSFLCSCKAGYRRLTDSSDPKGEKCIEVCNPNPCTQGQCSARGDHEFDCKCEAGFAGTLCNLKDEHFKGARINTIIVGVVLGGILLLTFILAAVYISRLKKQKSMGDPSHMLYNSSEMTERRHVPGGAVNNAFQRG